MDSNRVTKDGFFISEDRKLLQLERIHLFLSKHTYWAQDIPKEYVAKAIENSLCFGVYNQSKQQIGFARVVTDYATFAYICDVYIEDIFRGHGLSKLLMQTIMKHAALKNLRRICLATKDAHKLYEKFGFEATKTPENWMEIKDPDIYKKLTKPSTSNVVGGNETLTDTN